MDPFDRSFVDIRITHPNCPSNENKSLEAILLQHEKEKKDSYQERVTQVEKRSFTPLVFLPSGGRSWEWIKFLNKLGELIANKEKYTDVICHWRTKIRFAHLKATLVALHGFIGKSKGNGIELKEISFNLFAQIHTRYLKFRSPQIHYTSTGTLNLLIFCVYFFVLFCVNSFLSMMCVCLLHDASVLSMIFTYMVQYLFLLILAHTIMTISICEVF